MDDRFPIYAAVAGVFAPLVTVRAFALAVAAGLLSQTAGLAILIVGPLLLVVLLVFAGWHWGFEGSDPLRWFRSRPTVRDRLPESQQAALTNRTLDQPLEGSVPTEPFLLGVIYGIGVPVFALLLAI